MALIGIQLAAIETAKTIATAPAKKQRIST